MTSADAPWDAVRVLDRDLGVPEDPTSLISYARSAELDVLEQFPESEARLLDRCGVPAHYVPRAWGGTFERLDIAMQLLRPIARRDLTLAIGHAKTFLGCAPVWASGDDELCRILAADVLNGTVVSWALTEERHGSDLADGELLAEQTPDGYRLSGEKWLINNARRCHLVTVLARTTAAGGPRGHSLFLLDRRTLGPDEYLPMDRVRLHGIRGADISGFRLQDAPVGPDRLVGEVGRGVELTLRALQVTRVLCAGLSLGALDHALRIVVTELPGTRRYGHPLLDLPQSRRLLAEAVADACLAEALSWAAARGAHGSPGDLAVLSPATKYLAPRLADEVITTLASLLGTRSLLIGDRFAEGRFQKLTRDHRLVGIFDGSSHVNLAALITAFPFLRRPSPPRSADHLDARVTLPPLEMAHLPLVPLSGCGLIDVFPVTTERVRALTLAGSCPEPLADVVGEVGRAITDVRSRIRETRPTADPPLRSFDLAHEFSLCLAAAAAVETWLANRDHPVARHSEAWQDGLWLRGALARALNRLGRPAASETWRDDLAEVIVRDGPGLPIGALAAMAPGGGA